MKGRRMSSDLTTTAEESSEVHEEMIGEAFDGEEEKGSSSSGKKKLILIIGGLVTLFLIGFGVLYFTSLGNGIFGRTEPHEGVSEKKEVDIDKVQYTNLPELLINLRTADGRSAFLKAVFIIESSSEEISKKVDKLKPVLSDQFQVYLRELDIEDLKGSAGMERIRLELIKRTNSLIAPEQISNVLFKDFLVQ